MTPTNNPNAVKIIPLGGLGEIGLNMMVLEYEGKILLIDCGLMFPEDFMLGVDIVIPDFSFLENRADDILALIITHAHEDHIGAVPFLLREIDPIIVGLKTDSRFSRKHRRPKQGAQRQRQSQRQRQRRRLPVRSSSKAATSAASDPSKSSSSRSATPSSAASPWPSKHPRA